MRIRAAVLVVALAAFTLAGCATPNANGLGPTSDARAAGITVRGVGQVTGTPDLATVELGVETRASTAAEALTANTDRSTALQQVLTAHGVAPADVRTSTLTIDPTYTQPDSRITGYQVTNLVTVTVRDVSATGPIIDAAAAAAGDAVRVNRLSFDIDDASQLRAAARTDAVHTAQEQARQLADAAGVSLGPIRTLTELPQSDGPQPYPSATADRSVPVQPGSRALSVVVEIVYEIG